jgi:hypothetical protein
VSDRTEDLSETDAPGGLNHSTFTTRPRFSRSQDAYIIDTTDLEPRRVAQKAIENTHAAIADCPPANH